MVVVLRKDAEPFHTILSLLPKITDAEWQQIVHARKARAQFKAATSSAEVVPLHDYDWMLDIISRELVSYGMARLSIQSLRSRDSGFNARASAIQEWLTRAMPDGKHIEHVALFTRGVNLLIEDLQRMHVVVSHGTLLRHLDRLPAVVDRAFPGYARCRILGWIVRAGGTTNVRDK